MHIFEKKLHVFGRKMHIFWRKCMDFRKSGRFCTGKCVKFSYIYIKNAIWNVLILTKFPVFSHSFDYFDSKTLKNSNWVDGKGMGVAIRHRESVSKIFRGLLSGFRVVAIPELLGGVSGLVSFWDFWVSGGMYT